MKNLPLKIDLLLELAQGYLGRVAVVGYLVITFLVSLELYDFFLFGIPSIISSPT
jgi:hypothetical protein